MKTVTKQPLCDAPEAVMCIAGDWLARRDRGFTAVETAEFERWRAANPSHAAAVAQLEKVMSTFDRLGELAPASGVRPDPEYFAPKCAKPNRRMWHLCLGATALAAAAAVAVMFTRPSVPAESPTRIIASTADATERTTLADGSTVSLNRASRIEVAFSGNVRRVRLLHGEAHFQVATNPARPFVVVVDGVTARAVGTAFSVRRNGGNVEVLVTEGRVQVDPMPLPAVKTDGGGAARSEGVLLGAGFHAVVPLAATAPKTQVAQLSAAEMAQRLAWQPRLVELANTTLADAVAEFNRRTQGEGRVHLVIGDAELAGLRIGGSIYPDQTGDFVRLLERSFDIKAERDGDTITLRRAR